MCQACLRTSKFYPTRLCAKGYRRWRTWNFWRPWCGIGFQSHATRLGDPGWLPTQTCGICGEQSGTGIGFLFFLRVFRFSSSIIIRRRLHTYPCSYITSVSEDTVTWRTYTRTVLSKRNAVYFVCFVSFVCTYAESKQIMALHRVKRVNCMFSIRQILCLWYKHIYIYRVAQKNVYTLYSSISLE